MQIHFSPTDIARVRVVADYGPLAETMLSLGALRRRSPGHQYPLADMFQTFTPLERAVFGFLRPWSSTGADLSTLAGPVSTMLEGQRNLLDSPLDHFAVEVTELPFLSGRDQGLPWRADAKPCGSQDRDRLVDMVGRLHERLVSPLWSRVRDHLEAAKAYLSRQLSDGGVEDSLPAVSGPDPLGPRTLSACPAPHPGRSSR